jgi:glycosyltransferase involved in cell wall biosynthesis
MTTCIIQGLNQFHSSSFIRAHVDLLAGEKVALTEYYPNLTFKGRQIRYFYSQNPRLKKLKKLLPHWLYHRYVTLWEETYEGRHDAIAGFMQQHGVDVILAEFGIHGANICPHARDLGIPLIVHFHGHDAHRDPLLEDFKDRYRAMFDYAFRLISVSHHMTEKLVRMGADPAKIVYNPYGPSDIFYQNQPDYGKTLVAIGRFTDIKAPYLTLMAFRQVLDTHPDANLIMGGTGELQEVCQTLAKTWGIEAQVSFPGALRHEQVLELFSHACGFVQHSVTPTYGDAEGTPVTILEAGAAALPVVSTRHAGIPDAVVHGETGFLVEERDVEGMAQYMAKVLADSAMCRNMGEAAREHIRKNYNINRHIACIDGVIAEARLTV